MSTSSLVAAATPRRRGTRSIRAVLLVASVLMFAQLFSPIMVSPAAAADDFRLVTVSDTRSDGWALYDIGGQTHRQWVNNTCRTQLVDAGATLEIVNYGNEIGIHPKTTAWKNCDQLENLIDTEPPDPGGGEMRLVTVSDTRSDGWALYDIGGQTHRQWVNNTCRTQLVNAGATLEIVNYGNEIGIHPKTTAWKNCDQLEDLISADGPGGPDDPPARERVVKGTLDSTAWSLGPNPTGNPSIDQPKHGGRVYCTVSHLSYDDPVVFPNQPGAAHLHTFWGNTKADATTTTSASLAGGATSCEGGVNNQSSYWMPTLFDDQNRAVLPESIFVYYKSFFSGAYNGNRHMIQPVPNGLQMLANKAIPGSNGNFRTDPHNGKVQLIIRFPNCLQVHGNGSPVLSSNVGGDRDRNAHLAYSNPSNGTPNECPSSHPYRIPSLEYIVRYDVPNDSNWSLSSDMGGQSRGATLHADYIARWDDASMDALVRCNREMRPQCEFAGRRSQLPDRFVAPDGTQVYSSSANLIGSRTPYGTSLPKMQ